jgi:hypothetical protein
VGPGIAHEEAASIALEAIRAMLAEDEDTPVFEPAIVPAETIERPWGWVFFWNTRLYAETGDLEHAMRGTAPVCVNRADGKATPVEPLHPIERAIRRYERRIGASPWWRFWR